MVTAMKRLEGQEVNMLHRFFTEEGEIIEERDTNQLIQAGDEITLVNKMWKVTKVVPIIKTG